MKPPADIVPGQLLEQPLSVHMELRSGRCLSFTHGHRDARVEKGKVQQIVVMQHWWMPAATQISEGQKLPLFSIHLVAR